MSLKMKYRGQFSDKTGSEIDVKVNLIQFKDTGSQVIYAPAMEVYGYGRTVKEAKESFTTCLMEFLEYTLAKGTLTTELKRLGWR